MSAKNDNADIDLFNTADFNEMDIPIKTGISAGFPSPAADFTDTAIDLNKHLIKHPSATYFGRVKGDSMKGKNIDDGDLIIIDKSIEAKDGKIAVCFIDGEFTLKQLKIDKSGIWLMPANDKYKPILCTNDSNLQIWGVVTYVIKKV